MTKPTEDDKKEAEAIYDRNTFRGEVYWRDDFVTDIARAIADARERGRKEAQSDPLGEDARIRAALMVIKPSSLL